MQYIIVVDGVRSTRYKFNFHNVIEYEDSTISKDSRMIFGDDIDEFCAELKNFLRNLEKDSE